MVKSGRGRHDVDYQDCAPWETELQNKGMATKTIAVSLALTAFAVAVVAGLMAGNSASQVLKVALFSMIVCHVVGVFVGMICEHAVTDHLAQMQDSNPVPDVALEVERAFAGAGDDVIEV